VKPIKNILKHLTPSLKVYLFLVLANTHSNNVNGQATGNPKEDFLYGE
jgi:hypothetical protein